MQSVADGLGAKHPIWLAAFHALAWASCDHGKMAAIVELTHDCDSLEDLVRSIVTIDGVRYVCHSFELEERGSPPYRKGQLVTMVVTSRRLPQFDPTAFPPGTWWGFALLFALLARPMGIPPFGGCRDTLSLDTGRKAADSAALGTCTKGNCEMAMKQYWCKVLNQEGRVKAREILEGSNDNEAFGGAQGYLIQDPSIRTVEVWLEDRYVGKIHSR